MGRGAGGCIEKEATAGIALCTWNQARTTAAKAGTYKLPRHALHQCLPTPMPPYKALDSWSRLRHLPDHLLEDFRKYLSMSAVHMASMAAGPTHSVFSKLTAAQEAASQAKA